MKTSWQVATAAEAFAAAQFARCGWDVSVQYGANQPEYDLVAVNGDDVLKVSVKGSKDGSWGLTQSLLKDANYHLAIDQWLAKHSKKTVFCLVQFKDVSINELPRMYLATPQEIGARLKAAAAGRGDTILHEKHAWGPRARGAGTIEQIPDAWRFSEQKLSALGAAQRGAQINGQSSAARSVT
jgi:Holliday junction resolvase-like predicted endonuclease